MHFAVVTFNENEAKAIDDLLNRLTITVPGWHRHGRDAVRWSNGFRSLLLHHHPLLAQGNVVAATRLAQFFGGSLPLPDFVIFYGCAGVVDSKLLGHVFLVGQATYASLGTVRPGTKGQEDVTLKNRWLCYTGPKGVEPLGSVSFPDVLGLGLTNLPVLTGIEAAHVLATDKVVKVPVSRSAPKARRPGPPRAVYADVDWTYAEALAYTQQECSPLPLLVEMEAFGIGMIAAALRWEDRVVIIRVTTDDLVDHTGSAARQATLLLQANRAVLVLILSIIDRAWGP